jgi:hypothetical protein
MADDSPSELDDPVYDDPEEETRPDDSLLRDVRALAEDLRTAVEAEVAFQSARAGYVAREAGGIAVRLAVAALLALIAIMALAIGVLIGLVPLVGPWAATAIVVGALLIAALILALAGRARIRRLSASAFPKAQETTP